MIRKLQYSIETISYMLLEMTFALEVKDAVKFSGYAPENINGNTKPCFDYPTNCIQSCILNDLCIALASHHETALCDSFLLVFYGRVILKSNQNSTTWVKGKMFSTYFHILERFS